MIILKLTLGGKMSKSLMDMPKFDYVVVPINKLRVNNVPMPGKDYVPNKSIEQIQVDGEPMLPTKRFWESFCSRFQMSPSIFRWFSHREVFDRISERCNDDKIQICVQTTPYAEENINPEKGFQKKMLGATLPEKNMIYDDQAIRVLNALVVEHAEYRDGVIVTKHSPHRTIKIAIGSDNYDMKLLLEMPIDGYGTPNVFLGMYRNKCKNWAVAYSKVFRSTITLGKKDSVINTITRVMNSYNNEDGFIALKQRLAASQQSYASVYECIRLARMFKNLAVRDFRKSFVHKIAEKVNIVDKDYYNTLRGDIFASLWKIAGDLRAVYGVAQLESISEKRMRALPATCSVYDLLNFSTEIATHQLMPEPGRRLQGFFGEMIGREYDLEDSKTEFGEFSDFINENSRFVQDSALITAV